MKFLLLLLSLLAVPSDAIEVKELSLQFDRFHDSARIPSLYPYKAHEGLALNMNLNLWGPVYWDNQVHALMDTGQYRSVGWEFQVGLAPMRWLSLSDRDWLRIAYRHHSQHLLEALPATGIRFPVEDSFFVKLFILGGGQ